METITPLLGRPGPHPRAGVVSARSIGQPSLFNLRSRASGVSPNSLAHALKCCVRPSYEIKRIAGKFSRGRLLIACSKAVAQTQFSGEYGPLLSTLSTECRDDGRGPISDKKIENSSHLWSTMIPRPPYAAYAALFGLLHRFRIPLQILYSAVFVPPCLVEDARIFSRCAHVQSLRRPILFHRLFGLIGTMRPQTQAHSHFNIGSLGRCSTAVRDPNTSPMLIYLFMPNISTYAHIWQRQT